MDPLQIHKDNFEKIIASFSSFDDQKQQYGHKQLILNPIYSTC